MRRCSLDISLAQSSTRKPLKIPANSTPLICRKVATCLTVRAPAGRERESTNGGSTDAHEIEDVHERRPRTHRRHRARHGGRGVGQPLSRPSQEPPAEGPGRSRWPEPPDVRRVHVHHARGQHVRLPRAHLRRGALHDQLRRRDRSVHWDADRLPADVARDLPRLRLCLRGRGEPDSDPGLRGLLTGPAMRTARRQSRRPFASGTLAIVMGALASLSAHPSAPSASTAPLVVALPPAPANGDVGIVLANPADAEVSAAVSAADHRGVLLGDALETAVAGREHLGLFAPDLDAGAASVRVETAGPLQGAVVARNAAGAILDLQAVADGGSTTLAFPVASGTAGSTAIAVLNTGAAATDLGVVALAADGSMLALQA